MNANNPLVRQLLLVASAAVLVVVVWTRGYQPAHRAAVRDRTRATELAGRVAETEAMLLAAGGEAAWLAQHQKELVRLKTRFPHQDQLPQLFNRLIETVKTGELKLVNVVQGNPEPVEDAGQPVLMEGVPSYRLPVTVTIEGRYHKIVAALEQLTGPTFPGVVGIQQVEFQVREPTPQLDATLTLHLYVTGRPLAVVTPVPVAGGAR